MRPKRGVRTAVVCVVSVRCKRKSGLFFETEAKRPNRRCLRRFSKSQKNFGVSRRRFWRARFSAVLNSRKRSDVALRQTSTFRCRKRDVRFHSRFRHPTLARRLATRRKILGPWRRKTTDALRRKRRKSAPTFFIYAPGFKRRARVAFPLRRAAARRCVSRRNPAKTKRRDVRFNDNATTQRNSSPTLAPPFVPASRDSPKLVVGIDERYDVFLRRRHIYRLTSSADSPTLFAARAVRLIGERRATAKF